MDDVAWLDDEEQRIWRKVIAVLEFLPAAIDAQLQCDAGLTHFSYMVLSMLSEAPDRTLRMSSLASYCNASPSRLSHMVAKLEARGWVRRERTPHDARGTLAVLTDEGHAKVVATAPGHVAAVRSLILDPLTRAQLRNLEGICERLLDRLGADRPPLPPP